MTEAHQPHRLVRAVEPASMVDQVAKEIRRSILSGSLKPGQAFSLREIAAQLEISFIPVREALRQLEAQGLVVTRPGRSAYVAPLSRDDLNGIYQLRRKLEPDIAARACRMLDEAAYARLQVFTDMLGEKPRGIDDVYEAHHQFHLELLRPAATTWDLRVLDGLWHAAERYVRLAFLRRDAEPTEHLRRSHAHVVLLETIRRGDPHEVSREVLHHLHENEMLAQQALEPWVKP